jgi:hypothetical protein
LGKKTRYEEKVKHLKDIDLFYKVRLWWQNFFKKKVENLKKTLGRMEKKNSMEKQNPAL